MSNRVALVTGGMGGIGTAICQVLSAQGVKVIATYHRATEEEAEQWRLTQASAGYSVGLHQVDVASFESCQKMADDLEQIDILVNNAGVTRDVQCYKMPEDSWRTVIDTNLTGIFNVTRSLINGMIERRYGRIINISSVNAQKGQFGQVNYAASKSGMYGFTKSLALEVARKGITVNAISPGYIETEMVMVLPEEVRAQISAQIPVGRLGKPQEIARAVAFLAAEESGFITGSNLSINGGHYMD